jgi:hypothetical protein
VLYYNVNFAFLLVDHAAARYKSLREKYRREKLVVSREYKSGTSPSQREQWPLFNVLSFLDKQIRPRKSSCSIKSSTGAYYHFGQYVGEVLAKLSEQEADLAVEDMMSVLLNAKRKCRGQLC